MPRENRPRKVFYPYLLWLLLSAALLAGADSPARDVLPQDSGTAGLRQMLLRLRTTARLMHTTAHPDDEDGAMLVLESRGKGASVLLLTLNRGEGGQNKMGSNLFDALGVLRTLELLTSDRYYGVEQRFTHVADFGFSKSAQESFEKWKGHDTALSDMVRVIRTFRPDVVTTRFQGTPRDGHGHHQAAGILTREAFRAAADPTRFPEQLRGGLLPWQAKKLYMDNVRPPDEYTVQLDTGATSAALGMSYAQFAMQGLKHQLSQGAGAWQLPPGPRSSYYKLIDSVLPPPTGGHEQDFFEGIDTSLPGLASRLGPEESKAAFLRPALIEIEQKVSEASAAADQEPSRAAAPLLAGLKQVSALADRVEASSLSPAAKAELLTHLRTKQQQFAEAANLALALTLEATLDNSGGNRGAAPASPVVVPGETFTLTARLHNGGSAAVEASDIEINLPAGWKAEAVEKHLGMVARDRDATVKFRVTVPKDAAYTRPYFHRNDPETETIYSITDPAFLTLPFSPPPVSLTASYQLGGARGVITATAEATARDEAGRLERRPLAVAPSLSILLEPVTLVLPTALEGPAEVKVKVQSNAPWPVNAVLRIEAPPGWRVEPAARPLTFTAAGEQSTSTFKLSPTNLKEGVYQVRALARYQDKDYDLGYSVVTREDLGTFYYYQPAVQRVSAVEVQVPKDLVVGYIMGAGDDIPAVLQQAGLQVEMVSPEELAGGNLSRYGTIILGIRTYDTRNDVRQHNQRLLDYVAAGGTLLVQYTATSSEFNAGNYTPYPAQVSRSRVAVEEAPVEILAPEDSIFRYPNQITARDFEGWVQERGLYFMNQWDSHFEPLLSSHDPGEAALEGGMLRAHYGKGIYLYTGYAFFRQLPVGVPGALRLYINLLSAGHEKNAVK